MRLVVALVVGLALGGGLWLLIVGPAAETAGPDLDEGRRARSSGGGARAPGDGPMSVPGKGARASAEMPVDPEAMAQSHAERLPVVKRNNGYLGSELLDALRERVRVRFVPRDAEARFQSAVIWTPEDFGPEGPIGADLVRVMQDAGWLAEDRGGAMYILEIEKHEDR